MKTLLLVDDEVNIINSLKRALHGEKYSIVTAADATEALELLRNTPVDLVISDIGMPGINGLDFLKIVKETYPDTARIILTGQSDTPTVLKAINEGEVYRYFTKPWANEEIRISIRQTLKHFEFLRAAHRMMCRMKEQDRLIQDLEERYPGITKDAAEDVFVLSDEYFSESLEDCMEEYFSETLGAKPKGEKSR